MEVVRDVAALIGVILSIISLATLCSKGGRAVVKKIFMRHTKEIQDQTDRQEEDITIIKNNIKTLLEKSDATEEVLKQQCRNAIKNIYYKYHKTKVIPLYERKAVDSTYKIYTEKFQGNSYATLLYNEIIKWDIDSISYESFLNEEDE